MADVETLVKRIDSLVPLYYDLADDDTRAVITNLTWIHRLMAELIVAQAREREHWAIEARNATDMADEARRLLSLAEARVEEYEAHRCGGAA